MQKSITMPWEPLWFEIKSGSSPFSLIQNFSNDKPFKTKSMHSILQSKAINVSDIFPSHTKSPEMADSDIDRVIEANSEIRKREMYRIKKFGWVLTDNRETIEAISQVVSDESLFEDY